MKDSNQTRWVPEKTKNGKKKKRSSKKLELLHSEPKNRTRTISLKKSRNDFKKIRNQKIHVMRKVHARVFLSKAHQIQNVALEIIPP